jgi:hypothetical protein
MLFALCVFLVALAVSATSPALPDADAVLSRYNSVYLNFTNVCNFVLNLLSSLSCQCGSALSSVHLPASRAFLQFSHPLCHHMWAMGFIPSSPLLVPR